MFKYFIEINVQFLHVVSDPEPQIFADRSMRTRTGNPVYTVLFKPLFILRANSEHGMRSIPPLPPWNKKL
jgi:hypothetical protein